MRLPGLLHVGLRHKGSWAQRSAVRQPPPLNDTNRAGTPIPGGMLKNQITQLRGSYQYTMRT